MIRIHLNTFDCRYPDLLLAKHTKKKKIQRQILDVLQIERKYTPSKEERDYFALLRKELVEQGFNVKIKKESTDSDS